MKKFVIRIIIFCCLLVAIDIVAGYGFRYLVKHAKSGYTRRGNEIIAEMTDDIIILGSSRARSHYNPNIISDSLGMTCANIARDGQGIVLMYGMQKMVNRRYAPKVMLYEVTESSDLLVSDNSSFLNHLKYYYHVDGIDSIFWDIDPTERIKMISNIYQHNNNVIGLVGDNHFSKQNIKRSFNPLTGVIPYEPEDKDEDDEIYEYDELKLKYLERLINERHSDTKLIFLVSPRYKKKSDKVLDPLYALAQKHGIPVVSHYTDTTFTQHREYFRDSGHLNSEGADAYTKVVAGEIRQILQERN